MYALSRYFARDFGVLDDFDCQIESDPYFLAIILCEFSKFDFHKEEGGGGPDPSTLPLDLRMKYIMIDIFYRTVPLYL